MNKIFSLLLPLLTFFYASTAIAEECLRYEPEKVELSGTIVEKTFPGPPEYESIEKGDIPETVWILELLSPICVLGDEDDEINTVTVRAVKAVHLVLNNNEYKQREKFLFGKVLIRGTLFLAHTGHHRTDILMDVISILNISAESSGHKQSVVKRPKKMN